MNRGGNKGEEIEGKEEGGEEEMSRRHRGRQTIELEKGPSISGYGSVVGKKEGEGPLGKGFDKISEDSYFGEKSWERAESRMQKEALAIACEKAGIAQGALEYVIAGDLLNQCTASSYSIRDSGIAYWGIYGACSTMAEGLGLGSVLIDGSYSDTVGVITSSHFCTAERQFRTPLEYGGQRTPTAQWTATGAGAVILTAEGNGPYITHITTGRVVDAGIKDVSNMGAAMAMGAYDTLTRHFEDLKISPSSYDLIVTGDLGVVGHSIVLEFFKRDGYDISAIYDDCGRMLYDIEKQDVHAGGSGCGCSASVLCSHVINGITSGRWKKVLYAATGALMSPVSTAQGESIPGICHAVTLSSSRG